MSRYAPSLIVLITTFLGSVAAAQYETGHLWCRFADWTPGTVQGMNWAAGNPDADSVGNRVWSYEWISGGGDLQSSQPWYTMNPQLMVCDTNWLGSGQAYWAYGDDTPPVTTFDHAAHHITTNQYAVVPLMRWTNPAGDGVGITLNGQLRIQWSGPGGNSVAADADVVIIHVDSSSGTFNQLIATTVSNPNPGSILPEVIIPVATGADRIDGGDQIIVSIRSKISNGGQGYRINLYDNDLVLSLTHIPPKNCPADISPSNGDGNVNIDDLLAVINAWGTCP